MVLLIKALHSEVLTELSSRFLQVRKFRFFPKNFRTSTTELFQNSRKRKVRKIPSNTGPYCSFCRSDYC